MPLETMTWNDGVTGELPGILDIIDQRKLPAEAVRLELKTVQETWDAIKTLAVRGAPAIGCAAAYGVVVGAQTKLEGSAAEAAEAARAAADHLATSRPTAVNLFWALDRMKDTLAQAVESSANGRELCAALLKEAKAINAGDLETCRQIGKHGASVLPNPARVLTHCNAGGLATAGYGTALGCFYAAKEAGMDIEVMACETRPLLQGARLTTYELQDGGVPVTLMSDGMAAFAMQKGKLNAVIVGADRIARNGDAANKIGTYSHAVAAKHHGIPFYVAAPKSTFDLSLSSGDEIPIEEREREELSQFNGRQIAPDGVPTWNPAFDVTPAALLAGIITEFGVISPVTEENVLKVLGEA